MTNTKDKLRERLGLGSPTEIPLLSANNLDLANRGIEEKDARGLLERIKSVSAAPLVAYLVFDTTTSMDFIINAARECIGNIGRELLGAGKNLEVAVLGAGDHCDEVRLRHQGVKLLGNYGQFNDPTTNVGVLEQQIKKIVGTGGGDEPEAYECLAADLAQIISQDKIRNDRKKHVVVFFGDSRPHQGKARMDDHGCPEGRGPEQLLILAAIADHSYFVDCQQKGDFLEREGYLTTAQKNVSVFEKYTFGIVQDSEKVTLVKFEQAKNFLPEAIIGMVKKVQGLEEYKKYLDQLPSEKKEKVMGLLGPGYEKR